MKCNRSFWKKCHRISCQKFIFRICSLTAYD